MLGINKFSQLRPEFPPKKVHLAELYFIVAAFCNPNYSLSSKNMFQFNFPEHLQFSDVNSSH
jgi:hypothetical protein